PRVTVSTRRTRRIDVDVSCPSEGARLAMWPSRTIWVPIVLIAVSVLSGAGDATAGHAGAGTNVVVTRDSDYGHVEPDGAISPRNASDLIGAAQFELGPRTRLPGTFASFDGGRNWRDNGLLPL